VLAVTPPPRFLEIGDATTCTYFSSPTPNIPIETPARTLPVLLLFSMGPKIRTRFPTFFHLRILRPASDDHVGIDLVTTIRPHTWFT
jgi:hypothetical protein